MLSLSSYKRRYPNFRPPKIIDVEICQCGDHADHASLAGTGEVVMQQKSLVIILMPWGRVGSNLCVDILLQSKQILLHNEPLTVIETKSASAATSWIASEQRRWLDENVVTPPNGCKLVIKIAAKSVADPSDVIAFLKRQDTTLIVMDRHDVLATAVSALRATDYAQRLLAETGTESWALGKGRKADVRPRVSYSDLCDSVDHILKSRKVCEQISEVIPVRARVWYEDLIANFVDEIDRIIKAVDLMPFNYEVRYDKFTPMPLSESIANPEVLGDVAKKYGLVLNELSST